MKAIEEPKAEMRMENQQTSLESNEYKDMKARVMSKEFLLDTERYVIHTQTISQDSLRTLNTIDSKTKQQPAEPLQQKRLSHSNLLNYDSAAAPLK